MQCLTCGTAATKGHSKFSCASSATETRARQLEQLTSSPPGNLYVYFILGKPLMQRLDHKLTKSPRAGSCPAATLSWCYHPLSPSSLLGCFGSTATRTIGVASKLRGVNGGQAGDVDSVADFSTKSCRPPIPNRYWRKKKRQNKKKTKITVILNENKNMIIELKKSEITLITKVRFKNSSLFT